MKRQIQIYNTNIQGIIDYTNLVLVCNSLIKIQQYQVKIQRLLTKLALLAKSEVLPQPLSPYMISGVLLSPETST